uniref:Fe2OG dioxygenase domain-containing protein n=1 Tax=Tetradesmus obliquus TaxID=3088 RepID=A0A383WJL7_TETOB|eukprot:jgi/Sobl393_1/17857/SZX77412.1
MLQALRGSAVRFGTVNGVLQRLLAVSQQHQTARSLQQSEGLQHAVDKLAKTPWPSQPWAVGSSRRLQTDARLPLERLQEAITPEVCAELNAKGYAVVDGVFGPISAHRLELELMHVHQAGLMHLNHTHLVAKGETQLLAKSQVMEAELTLEAAVREAAPLVAQLDADRRLATMLNLFLPQLRLDSAAIKMQHNEGGGGCFPMHFDSDELLDGRRVTAIFYLNQHWKPSHGGQLRLYPFPAPPVDIDPLQDRLVLFATTRMLHRVLPSRAPRSCFTIWLSEGRSKAAGVAPKPLLPPPDSGQPSEALWRFLMQPAVRQHVCKLAYADEWERSILESHPACEATEGALDKHRQEVAAISKALSKFQPGLGQLLSAAAVLDAASRASQAAATAGEGEGSASSSSSSSSGDAAGCVSGPTEEQLQEAVALLQQVAAHVKWF